MSDITRVSNTVIFTELVLELFKDLYNTMVFLIQFDLKKNTLR